MNKLLDSDGLANEATSEDYKVSATPEETGIPEESLSVDTDETEKGDLPEDTTPVEEPMVENPGDEDPVTTEPAIEEPVVEEPVVEEIIPEEPVAEEIIPEEPVAEAPVTEELVVEEPAPEESIPEALVADEPADIPSEEEAEVQEVTPETDAATSLQEIDKWDKVQIVEKLAEKVDLEISDIIRNEVETLRQAFYKLKKIEIEEATNLFVAGGGLAEDFKPEKDDAEDKLKELLVQFRDKKASLTAKTEKLKEDNLLIKKQIIERLKEMIESKDDFYKVYNEFRKLQQRWKEVKQVPQAAVNDLWKEYQLYSEKFYDLLKINNEMRDYDFKKNLELKQTLCESVEKLDSEKDVISAFYQLQKLHQEWREIGPVAKEVREEIWARFKKASSVINKKHQDHFESLRSLEHRNLEEKAALCEEMEAVDFSKLNSFKTWDAQNKRVLELQEKWKTIGFAPKKNNVKVFERFRAACDVFFHKKAEFYKQVKGNMDTNLEKKQALCEQAEALKESQDWKDTTDKLIALQKEWRSIGPVPRKFSESTWRQFIGACDYFFEQKGLHFSSQKSEEVENLVKKKAILEKINAVDVNLPAQEAISTIRGLISEWNRTGFVPFRDKEKINKEYQQAVDKHFDRLKVTKTERRLQSFKTNLDDISTGGEKSKNKLLGEREKLMRTYERLKNDIQTYENNIGFLSVSSKGGSGMVKEMNRKIESLKEELNLIVKKIEVIDDNFDNK
ncbi:MAG: DUF349 domain-containing protein [Dysgonamonadaceae bacterium]|jgi:hypothetical protein|nr:DUF349 domain-containing protein [Dysgonamonadaceae bacterium]